MRQAMNTMLNMNRAISVLMALLIIGNTASASDSIPSGFARPLQWHIETQVSPALVPGTNGFLQGDNPEGKKISSSFSGDIRADFRFAPTTQEGILYRGLYQGIGLSINTFFANTMLGTPVSAYLYQGAPILHFSNRLWLGYEWQFGAAFGWEHYDQEISDKNAVTSTTVTAHMGLGLKLHCRLSDRWQMSMGLMAKHYSNGNTSWPNAGVNSIGLDFVYLHKRSPLSNQAIALPVYWVSSNDFEFSSFLLLKDSGVVEWEDDYFDKRLFLAKYILKPTYTIEVHRTLWKKYKYIFLYKYNNTTRQGLAIPVEAVPKISRLIHAIIDGKKIVFKVGDKIRSYDVKNGAIDIGTVMHIYDSEQELVAKFEDGAWVRLQFCDCEIV